MDPLSIAALAGMAVKAGVNIWQGIKGQKQQKDLWANRPQLGVTAGETAANTLYEQQAAATEMPGQRQFEDKMSQTMAEGIEASQRTSQSSLGATDTATKLAMAKIQSIQDLSSMFAEYKQKRMDQLAQWKEKQIDLEQQRFQVNKYEPWNIKMNEAVDRKKAGWEGLMGTADQGLGMLTDLAGTKMYTDAIKGMYEQPQGVTNFKGSLMGSPIQGAMFPNAQEDLLKTAKGLRVNPKTPYLP